MTFGVVGCDGHEGSGTSSELEVRRAADRRGAVRGALSVQIAGLADPLELRDFGLVIGEDTEIREIPVQGSRPLEPSREP